jgi:CRISPR/Cas system-associated endonuclease Cas1
LHSIQFSKLSLVLDFQDLYRFLIDNIVVEYSRKLDESDFIFKNEMYANKKGKRQYLNKKKTEELAKRIDTLFRSKVDIPRIKVGKKQELETLFNEEAFLFAKI